jgi:predicted nucleotidyltransferase
MVPASMRRRALAEFVTRLRGALGSNLVELRLFGSQARGDATPDSDIDVLVVVRPNDARIARSRIA